jgi:hypothetical protein
VEMGKIRESNTVKEHRSDTGVCVHLSPLTVRRHHFGPTAMGSRRGVSAGSKPAAGSSEVGGGGEGGVRICV